MLCPIRPASRLLGLLCCCLLLGFSSVPESQAEDLTIYDDQLAPGFEDWSWATHDLANPSPVAMGTASISFEADGWEGLFFHATEALDLAQWSGLKLWIHGGAAGGQSIRLTLHLGDTVLGEIPLAAAPSAAWEERTLDFRAAGMAFGSFDGLILQDATGGDQATLFLDHLQLIEDDSPPPAPAPVTVSVDPNADRRVISPLIYGVNFGSAAQLSTVGYPLRRWGGNSVTRYNWRFDVTNRAFDWFFQNIPGEVADPGALPHGSSSDRFVDETLAAGSRPLMTAPAIGWTPLDDRTKKWGFSVAKYGPQLVDECSFFGANPPPWCSADSGNGTCDPAVNTTGFCSPDGLIVGNDPADSSQAIGDSNTTDWMAHLSSRVGTASEGGVALWAIDNEPMLWDSTHRDVHPSPATYDELWSRTRNLALAIKAQDSDAKVLGPAVWGWCAFFSSASDAAFPNGSCVDGPDRMAHGGFPLLEWYAQQNCAVEVETGVRPIDYLDVHFYPQGGVAGLGAGDSGEDAATAAKRLRSTRELWDPTWVSESWIGQSVRLVPRLREWIDAQCPGMGISLSEYRWGSDDGPSSALAHVDVLGILGREGVDLATRWVAPEAGSRVEDAFEIFLNYDGLGSRVEGDSVRALSSSEALGVYAVRGVADQLWLLMVNRDPVPLEATVSVASTLIPGSGDLFRFDGSNPLAMVGTVATSSSGFTVDLPARSASLVVAALSTSLLFADGFESGDTSAWSLAVP
ncbi:MAG: glycoside hydrolase family 44 protein [Deltaproteobacteria bacterium]|nr:glycoside hydrolase family 44 protein [Deltaproteobacteria bacterium]